MNEAMSYTNWVDCFSGRAGLSGSGWLRLEGTLFPVGLRWTPASGLGRIGSPIGTEVI